MEGLHLQGPWGDSQLVPRPARGVEPSRQRPETLQRYGPGAHTTSPQRVSETPWGTPRAKRSFGTQQTPNENSSVWKMGYRDFLGKASFVLILGTKERPARNSEIVV